ncbi:MAG: DegT/DnrJ/EryC1/StrS family aminotransferase, partial [Cytophagales bacterium]
REKGTNRAAFFRGEVDKYGWVDVGSSFLGADLNAAMLYAQLQEIEQIHSKRAVIWNRYYHKLQFLIDKGVLLPAINEKTKHNSHIFYIVANSLEERQSLIKHLKDRGVGSAFHYGSLHKSAYFADKYKGEPLPNSEKFADCLLRLPLFVALTEAEQDYIIEQITDFYDR